MTTWLVILAVGAGSFLMRAGPLLVGSRWTRSPAVERTMARAGTAATAALAASALTQGASTVDHTVPLGAAAAVALALAVRGATMLRVLLAGGLAYALIVGVVSVVA